MTTTIALEIVYSPGQRRTERVRLALPVGSTVADALREGAFEPGARSLAVWGRRATPQQILQDGDRIELLRPLLVDPKEARRRRASKAPAQAKRPAKAGR